MGRGSWSRSHRVPPRLLFAALIAAGAVVAVPSASSAAVCLPVNSSTRSVWSLSHLYNEDRGDNLTTSNPVWDLCHRGPGDAYGAVRDGYAWMGYEGLIFSPERPQPRGTVPLQSWWDPIRGDNFATTSPGWQPAVAGDTRSPNYVHYRLEGYVYDPVLPRPPHTLPLYSHWFPETADNDLTTVRITRPAPFRLEGYVPELPYNPYA